MATIRQRMWNAFWTFIVCLTLAVAAFVYLFSPVTVSAHAQSVCVPADLLMDRLAERPAVNRVILVAGDQAGAYLRRVSAMDPPEDASFIVIVTDNEAGIIPVVNGSACMEWGVIRIDLNLHREGMRAAFGEPS
jgi:hypothetical protein